MDHLEGGFGAFAAFVPDVASRSMDCLLHGVAGQDAKKHRDVCVQRNLAKAVADLLIDVLVMRRFTSNNGTEA